MLNFVLNSLVIALFTAWCLNVFTISGARDWCIMNTSKDILAKMLSCDFCLSFWSSLGISIMMCFVIRDLSLVLTPFIAAPIIKKLI